MSWDEISPELRDLMAEKLSDRELDMVKLMAANPRAGRRPLAMMMGVSDTRVRDLQRAVQRKMALLLAEGDPG